MKLLPHSNFPSSKSQNQKLTNITGEFIDVGFLQQPQLAHAGQGIESFHNDKLLSITEALLEQGFEDGGALPPNIGSNT